jgi:hypothetical protein
MTHWRRPHGSLTLLHGATHRATSCSVSARCTRTRCPKTHPLQEAAQACNVPAEDARRGSIICWRPHLLIIQGTCAAIRAYENDPFVRWPCSCGAHHPSITPSCQEHPPQQSRLPLMWIWRPCPPGGQGCFFWRFFLGGAGSSPSTPCSATAASAAASAAAFAVAAALSLYDWCWPMKMCMMLHAKQVRVTISCMHVRQYGIVHRSMATWLPAPHQ